MNTNMNPGAEVTMRSKRGVVTAVNAKTSMVEVMWIGGRYPVREDPADLVVVR